jgi:hypothetical protein
LESGGECASSEVATAANGVPVFVSVSTARAGGRKKRLSAREGG